MNAVTLKTTWQAIKADAKRYTGGRIPSHPGFWVTFSYRVRHLRKKGGKAFVLLLPLDIFFGLVKRFLSDTTLPGNMYIGAGLYLPHPNGIILNPMVEIGEHVSLFQQVTLGEWRGGAPKIGSHCVIFGGARVFGAIEVGHHCMLGANVVIKQDLPPHSKAGVSDPIIHTPT